MRIFDATRAVADSDKFEMCIRSYISCQAQILSYFNQRFINVLTGSFYQIDPLDMWAKFAEF
jgi:hypothetical protein